MQITTVVRCAEGHVFATARFPMRQLGSERIGPGRLLRCPRCARLRSAVPVSDRGAVEVEVGAGGGRAALALVAGADSR
ncbi:MULTISPECIES: hypothetical protein [Streptomyces]|uniref:Formate-dependent nitrite reductase complex subunit NrfF n=1 Tax=Streptomyces radicis TaxID=1750517 RepID=A0A3A9WPN4_9ACTN|nr:MULTISPECIES: hypothetical protein [Streptomyces]RBM14950.1 hypothetical protein DEH69_18415 [Streptomyces sp. PT12]RKN11464.1 hypothetical protein D7319_05865 [Streptomyces radicis]RKN26517.1 hypothetical protein D7318_03795 [Streptomyces radicis]